VAKAACFLTSSSARPGKPATSARDMPLPTALTKNRRSAFAQGPSANCRAQEKVSAEVKVPPSIATSSFVAKTLVEVEPAPGLSVRARLAVLSARTKPIRAKARWIRRNLGYPIRQSIEFVLRDPAWDERGLYVFMRRSIPGCLVIQQRLIRMSHSVIAILTAFWPQRF
jgi:hypothetical protein